MNNSKNTKKELVAEISKIKDNALPGDIKKLKLDSLEDVVSKLDQYSDGCEECNKLLNRFKSEILDELKSLNSSKQNNYQENIKSIFTHLRTTHNVVTKGFFVSIYLPVGIAIGFLIGSIINEILIGFAIGIVIGFIVGYVIDAVARKNGFVIGSS